MSMNGTALITGGAKRVGRALALSLADAGYDIALHYNSSEPEANATAETIRAKGAKCELFQADLTDHTQVEALVPAVCGRMENLTLLINNASIFPRVSFANTDEALFDDNINVHVKAPFFLAQHFAKHAKNGNIINMSDTYVRTNVGAYFAYLLSKKALTDLTPMLARELAPHIRVNALALGLTEFNDNLDRERVEKRKEVLPITGEVSADEICEAVRNILSHPTMTGNVLWVDHGAHLL